MPGDRDLCRQLLTSFGGVATSQIWADYYLWEMVLTAEPQLEAIVEIGTWKGGFSRYLAAQARERDLEFRTYDAIAPADPPPGFERVDVFAEAGAVIEYLHAKEPVILLCDGGNKPRELRTFATQLQPGSIVVAHDWGTEVQPADVPDSLEPIYEELCDTIGSMSRIFVPGRE